MRAKQEISKSARPNYSDAGKTTKHSINEKVEHLLDTRLDKLIRPEASNQGHLDLNKNELHV